MKRPSVNPEQPFSGPHQQQQVAEQGAPPSRAKAGVIMLHGRGATSGSILWLSGEFAQPDARYLAPQASSRTWYPYPFTDPIDKNAPWLNSALQVVHDQVRRLNDEGIPKEKIVLLGFSQGACLALEFAARHPGRYGGVVSLSGGLIGEFINPNHYRNGLRKTPVFLGVGDRDSHITVERVEQSADIMKELGGDITLQIYPGKGHVIVEEEVKYLRGLISGIIHDGV